MKEGGRVPDESRPCIERPLNDALELSLFVSGNQFGFLGNRLVEAGSTEVIPFADEKGDFEIEERLELGDFCE